MQQKETQGPTEITSLRSDEVAEQETVHEKKYKRLNHIAEMMLNLTSSLQSQHLEHIGVIQRKVSHIMKILDLFNGSAVKEFTMVGSIVRLKQNIDNIVKNVILDNGLKLSNDVVKILTTKLKAFVLNLKAQMANRNRINKRSVMHTYELIGKSLHVKKLKLTNRFKYNLKLQFLPVKSATLYLNGKISVRRLVVNILKNNEIAEGKRQKRAIPSLDHSKIICKTINNIALDNFIKKLFRRGQNTLINGL